MHVTLIGNEEVMLIIALVLFLLSCIPLMVVCML